jgi:phage terminase small subunit
MSDAREELFAREYLVDLNATQAAKRAGYSPDTAGQIGYALLKKVDIQSHIEAFMKERRRKYKLSHDRVIKELLRSGLLDIRGFFNDDGSLKPVKEWSAAQGAAVSSLESIDYYEGSGENRRKAGVIRKLKFNDKTRALELLGKHIGMFKNDRPNLEDLFGLLPKRIADRLRESVAELLAEGGAEAGSEADDERGS